MTGNRIGIFGGTFDPIHTGHLIVAQGAAELLGLDQVLFVPAGRPPHKCGWKLAPAELRFRMVRLAIAGNPVFAASDVELASRCRAYTVDTLTRLQRAVPKAKLFLLLGADQARLLSSWKEPERLFALATVCVLSRPGYDFKQIDPRWRRQIIPVAVSPIAITATAIRQRAREGRSIRYLVPEKVRAFIAKNALYK